MICQICKKAIESDITKKYFTDYVTRRLVGVMSCPECYKQSTQDNLFLTDRYELIQEPEIDYDEIPALD